MRGGGRLAPRFAGVAARAKERRPPLSAAAYLAQSILQPGAFLADGFANAMPANYADRLARAELGHIVAYLLTLERPAPEA